MMAFTQDGPAMPAVPDAPAVGRSSPETTSSDDLLRVEEVADAKSYVGELFRRRFGGEPPGAISAQLNSTSLHR
jgi:hypothetical protein